MAILSTRRILISLIAIAVLLDACAITIVLCGDDGSGSDAAKKEAEEAEKSAHISISGLGGREFSEFRWVPLRENIFPPEGFIFIHPSLISLTWYE